MTMMKKKLIDVSPDPIVDGGIFKALNGYNVPWKNDIEYASIDIYYYFNISGQKTISPLVNKYLNSDGELDSESLSDLAGVMFNIFGTNWAELYETLSYDYNPISNYDMTESETIEGETATTEHHTGTQANAHTGTQTDALQESVTTESMGESNNQLYGFNSSTAVNDSRNDTTTDGSSGTESTNTRTDNLSDTRTDNLTDTADTENLVSRTLTRSGNIGVTTSQQMVSAQRDLWRWNFIKNVVIPDVDSVLTIAIYS